MVAAALAPAGSFADWTRFLPRSFDTGAYLDLYAVEEHDDLENFKGRLTWQDTFLKEKLTLFSNGYVYHPRFLLYHFEVAGALKQEQFEASYLPPQEQRDGDGLEYDVKLIFLPEHAYNLELFALRFEPLLKEQWAAHRASIETSYGADFRYRKKPFFFHSRYSQDRVESGETRTDVTRAGVDGQYFKNFGDDYVLSFDAAYNPSRFDTTYGLRGSSTEARLGNLIDLKRYRLSSSVTHNAYQQETDATGRLENEQLAWFEHFTAYLPWHLRTDLSYRYQENLTTPPPGASGARTEFSSVSRDFDFDLLHSLYESLQSTYAFRRSEQTSEGGEGSSLAHSLAFDYTKSIPRGRLLANLNVGRIETENRGQIQVIEEGHPATPVPGSFLLARKNVDRETLVVRLRSPLPPNEFVELVEGPHYSVAEVAGGIELTVYALPAPFLVPGAYEIRVSYTLGGGRFEIRSDTFGHGASVELFENRLTPYYSFSQVRSEVVSGFYPGGSLDSTTFIAGLIYRWRILRARAEYQKVEWEVSPFEAWKGELQAAGNLGRDTGLYVTLAHQLRRYPEGRAGAAVGPYEERTSTAAASVQHQLFARRLVLALGGSYTRLDGLIDNQAYSANATATWKIGKLDFAVGASLFESETVGPETVANRRTHEYYYLKLRRRLF